MYSVVSCFLSRVAGLKMLLVLDLNLVLRLNVSLVTLLDI